MKEERLEELFYSYINKTASAQEEQELMVLLLDSDLVEKKRKLIEDLYSSLPESFAMSPEQANHVFDQVVSKPAVIRSVNTRLRRIVVAASVLLVIGASTYFLISKKDSGQQNVAAAALSNDIKAPGESKAMITLANGTTIALDSLSKGGLSLQNGVNVTRTEGGQIIYSGKSSVAEYNTLSNPRGSKAISLVLNDGTKLWLNCESSIRYPVAFSDKERKVEITGEAYFEAASVFAKEGGKKIPFIVQSGKALTEVIGTHFNINAYNDEATIAVTLLEGSVKVNNGHTTVLLTPGQQATLKEGAININRAADIDEVMAWKEGRFQFGEKADIKIIMRQVSRWYDVDVEYKGNITEHFGGSIPRTANISQLFKIMETTDKLKFELNGQKVAVSQVSD